ncbi:MAG: pseudouridine synthase [Bacillota bacterium]|nr:pseudouridine synthase [Bacillota bacterium]
MMRLQKFMATCGTSSRRKAEDIIKAGRVTVNGDIIKDMGIIVNEEADIVLVDGTKISIEQKKRYIILNKPRGYITSAEDQFGRSTVMDLVEDIPERIYPIGRLDYDTEGLLLLTNDGDFACSIAHPKNNINKVYIAKVIGDINEKNVEKLKKGVIIDGRKTASAKVSVLNIDGKTSEIKIVIHEGRNRQVRKMFEAVGCRVTDLKRVAVGKFNIGSLQLGKWREFTKAELKYIEDYKNGV